jgi:hypothetical protein
VVKLKVGLSLSSLLRLAWLAEVRGLAQMVAVQLVQEGLVSSLGEHALFLQDGQDTHGLETENHHHYFIKVKTLRRMNEIIILYESSPYGAKTNKTMPLYQSSHAKNGQNHNFT